jgi:hypothetical protein
MLNIKEKIPYYLGLALAKGGLNAIKYFVRNTPANTGTLIVS